MPPCERLKSCLFPPLGRKIKLFLVLILLSLIGLVEENAQIYAAPAPNLSPVLDNKENKDSPRFMFRQFLEIMKREDLDGAFNLIEFPRHRMSSELKRKLVRQLIEVLNKRGRIDLADISNLSEGKSNDAIQGDLEIIGRVVMHDESVPISLLRVDDEGRKIWRFAPEFVEQIPRLAEKLEESDIESTLPPAIVQNQFLGVKVWQWLGLVIAVILAFMVSGGLAFLLVKIIAFTSRYFNMIVTDQSLRGFIPPLRLLGGLLAFHVTVNLVELNLSVRQSILYTENVLRVFTLTFLALRTAEFVIDLIKLSFERQGRQASIAMLQPSQKAAKSLIIVISLVFLFRDLGFDVTAIVAGLGVGGLAIALAGQKTIENLFGGISVILDQPVRVGDSGRFGDIVGAVEEIGLRSTRVRTLDRSIVTIPNAEFSHMKLENFEKRDKIRWHVTLMIRSETKAEQMQLLLIRIKELLLGHPMVHNEPARVRFTKIGSAALEVEVFAFTRTIDWNEHLAIVEDLNLRIMHIVSDCGTSLAFPNSAIYSERGEGLNIELQELAIK
ncbi:MAG: mechanosensitive ion channel family protein, partial [Proteobacteria bacterium]|nr:mechanosensitive ion channel family protein [Pseudomonadota bacterium]